MKKNPTREEHLKHILYEFWFKRRTPPSLMKEVQKKLNRSSEIEALDLLINLRELDPGNPILKDKIIDDAIKDLKKNPIFSKNPLKSLSHKAQLRVSRKIGMLIRDEGLTPEQAAGKAYGMERSRKHK